ncbi:MAG: hypothetical protein JWN67_4632, partial [Actinomycetia bacterium]|nr:hypothetical protein [Actinomycetes bacterium]
MTDVTISVEHGTPGGSGARIPSHYAAGEPTGGVAPIELALGLAGLGLLILLTALFVAAELSLVAVDRDRVDALADQGSRQARTVSRALS